MKKSFNCNKILCRSPLIVTWLFGLLLTSLTTNSVIAQGERRIEYLLTEEVQQLTECEWKNPCLKTNRSLEDPERFFADGMPTVFQPWKDLWLNSSRQGNKYRWRNHLSPGTSYTIYQPKGVYSALLLRTTNELLTRAYRIKPDGREIEYRPLSEQPGPRIVYLSNHEVKELTNCMWAPYSCISKNSRSSSHTDLEYFFESLNPPAFKRWKRLWLDSPKDRWDHKWQWEDPLSATTVYRVNIPSASDPNSAVLLRTESAALKRAYRVLNNGQEIEYRPIAERPGSTPRDLVHISSARIQKLAGCAWGQTCEVLDVNKFFFYNFSHRHGTWSRNPKRDIFSRWSTLYMQTNPTTSEEVEVRKFLGIPFVEWRPLKEYSWYQDGRIYALSHPDPPNLDHDLYATMLLETKNSALAAIYKIRKDGSEVEYRPINGEPELSLRAYRSVQIERHPWSTYYDDITDVQYSYLSSEQLRKKYGISWNSSLRDVKHSRLTRNLKLRDPNIFFEQSGWSMPTWESTARYSKERRTITGEYWVYNDDLYYPFSDAPHSVIRILRFVSSGQDQASLSGVLEYRKGGIARIIRPEEERVTKETHPPSYTYEDGERAEQLQWHEPPREFLSSFDEPTECNDRRPLVVDEPSTFFRTRGQAFTQWRKRIGQLQDEGRYRYIDQSWIGSNGNRYFLRRDSCWQSQYGIWGNPKWQILEYENDELVRVYDYNSFWQETIYERLPLPTLEDFLDESPEVRLRRMVADRELTQKTITEVRKRYPRPRSEEVRDFLARAQTIARLHEVSADKEQAVTVIEKKVDFPYLKAHAEIMASVTAILILFSILLIGRWRRNVKDRFRADAARRRRRMGFDE